MKRNLFSAIARLWLLLLLILPTACADKEEELLDEAYGKCSELTMTFDRGTEHWVETFRVSQDIDKLLFMPTVKKNYFGTGFDFQFQPIYRKYSDAAYGNTEGSYGGSHGYYEVAILNFDKKYKNCSLATMLSKGTIINEENGFETEFSGSYINTTVYRYVEGSIYVKDLSEEIITLEFKKVKYVDYNKEPNIYMTLNGTMSYKIKD